MPLIDTHCHLDFTDFDHDRERVIAACVKADVSSIIVPATQFNTWQRTLRVGSSSTNKIAIHVALGLHPVFNAAHQPQHLLELEQLSQSEAIVAIGEIGLDFHASMGLTQAGKEKQIVYFEKQVLIAKQLAKPVIVHNRKAHDECIKILRQGKVDGGVIHAFNGSIQHAEHYIELGFALGFGGMLTYPRSRKLQALVKAIPLNNIVLETDAPDMTVMAHRGERNNPAYLPDVLAAIAHYKQLDVDQVAAQTTLNAQRIFGLSSS